MCFMTFYPTSQTKKARPIGRAFLLGSSIQLVLGKALHKEVLAIAGAHQVEAGR
jgi:hypothetical protein